MAHSNAPLFQTSHGRVIRCACCEQLEITFRGERLRLSPADFRATAQTVERAWHDLQLASRPSDRWRLTTYTASGEASVDFRIDEIEALRELLRGTSAMLELDAILQDVLYS